MATFFGTDNIDTLLGTEADDFIFGLPGDDVLLGFSGNDLLDGGDGNDQIKAGSGIDLLVGGNGDDTLNGEEGNDALFGEEGNDRLDGGQGNDLLRGGNGNDFLNGGDDSDTLSGGNNNDFLDGGNGKNLLFGDDGSDVVFGGSEDDTLDGGRGNDSLRGGNGKNILRGGDGDDAIDGGKDSDLIDAGNGNDGMRGGDGNDTLSSGAGNDVLLGEGNNDTLRGGDGDDVIEGDAVLKLFGLTDRNTLIAIDANIPSQTKSIQVKGLDGTLLGIDFRPRDGLLYGITDTNKIYTIDFNTGATKFVSTLSTPFNSGQLSGVDFNPVPDRLRVVGDNDQNFRIDVDRGAVADLDPNDGILGDRLLRYDPTDPNAAANASITAIAYTNSFSPSPDPNRRTTLYGIDTNLDILVRQGGLNFPDNPPTPNEGRLFTIGNLGIDFAANSGFDILAAPNGVSLSFAVSNSTLYSIDLSTGAATNLGTIGDGSFNVVGLAATITPDPNATGNDAILGGAGNDILSGGAGNDRIIGESGNDALLGGAGNDTLTGGANNDSFMFNSNAPFNSNDLGVDRITDFVKGVDQIVLDQTTFGAITPAQIAIVADDALAATNAGLITYSTATGNLFFNQNGANAGLGTGARFARLDNAPVLAAADFVIVA
ncbi:MAG: DUF4394 domain-containing protein [Cyanobacteria bacterium CRU_2_1]|nr:DUF4394 domain-containing protein [Cyanobacteria bacterium CRU_2_1]